MYEKRSPGVGSTGGYLDQERSFTLTPNVVERPTVDDNSRSSSYITGGKDTRELSVRNNNPGNIRQGSDGFRKYKTMEEGFGALTYQLDLYKTGKSSHTNGNETLGEMMAIYAPASDNNQPKKYAAHLAKKLGVTVDTPIRDLNTKSWAGAISSVESPQAFKILVSKGLLK